MMFFRDNFTGDRQSKSGAFANGFSGKTLVKNSLSYLLLHANAIISNFDRCEFGLIFYRERKNQPNAVAPQTKNTTTDTCSPTKSLKSSAVFT